MPKSHNPIGKRAQAYLCHPGLRSDRTPHQVLPKILLRTHPTHFLTSQPTYPLLDAAATRTKQNSDVGFSGTQIKVSARHN